MQPPIGNGGDDGIRTHGLRDASAALSRSELHPHVDNAIINLARSRVKCVTGAIWKKDEPDSFRDAGLTRSAPPADCWCRRSVSVPDTGSGRVYARFLLRSPSFRVGIRCAR